MKLRTLFSVALAAAPLALAACSDSTGTNAPGQVQLRFGVASGALALKAPAEGLAQAGGPLAITGANGTLSITSIRMVLDKFQLRGVHDQPCTGTAGANDDNNGVDDDAGECEFEAGPLFLDLPLDGSQLAVATGAVPPGTYDHVRFRVKNLDSADDDESGGDDNDDAAEAAVFGQVRAQFPDWPARASMRVTGTFTPTGGAPRSFAAYLNAEVRLELPISPPLAVTEGSSTGQVSVLLDPSAIFRTGANVLDLSQVSGVLRIEFRDGAFRGEGHHGGNDD